MLFLQDDLRIRSATYAILPTLNLDNDEPCLKELELHRCVLLQPPPSNSWTSVSRFRTCEPCDIQS